MCNMTHSGHSECGECSEAQQRVATVNILRVNAVSNKSTVGADCEYSTAQAELAV